MIDGAKRIASFDGIRGLAILLVIIGHTFEAFGPHGLGAYAAIFDNAGFGVRLFFVLSGFLITSLLMKEKSRFGRIDFWKFIARRTIRIFPLLYIYVIVIFVLAKGGYISVSNQQLFAAVSYTWNYHWFWDGGGYPEGHWFLGHLWSLSLEEQFYLIWPLCISALSWVSIKHLSWVIPLLMPFVRIAVYFMFPSQRGYLGMMFHTAVDPILIGCFFAIWREPLLVVSRRWSWISIFALIFPLILSPLIAEWWRAWRVTFGFGSEAVCAGFLIVGSSNFRWLESLFSSLLLVWLGRMSYSLYLWQQLFLTEYNTTWTGNFPSCLGSLFFVAVCSYWMIERPLMILKRRFEKSTLSD